MMPYSRINIGDIFASPLAWAGSDLTWEVVDKDKTDKMIEVRPIGYEHPLLPKTIWKKPSDRLFTRKIFDAKKCRVEQHDACL